MQKSYPAVRFVVRRGALAAWMIPAATAAAGLVAAAVNGNVWWLVGSAVVAGLLFCALRVFVELVQIIAETLLPQ